jgi:phosphoribosylanthranilate isomerase
MKIKVCGITRPEDACAAAGAGADALGFVFYGPSPRNVAPGAAAEICRGLPPFLLRVAVVVDPSDDEVRRIEAVFRPDLWQLHGDETPERCRELAPRRLLKALGFPRDAGPPPEAYPVDGFVLDRASPRRGGTGETIDWAAAAEFVRHSPRPCLLSGGLTPENVVPAIERVRPYGVDASSGLETGPGIKDPGKIRAFIQRCRTLS